MSEVPISSPYRSTPDAPVTDDERNSLGERVNAAFTAGAIDADDYKLRLDRLFGAQRMGELLVVVEGLPPLPTYASPAIVADAPDSTASGPGELAPARSATNLAVITAAGLAGAVLVVVVLLVILLR